VCIAQCLLLFKRSYPIKMIAFDRIETGSFRTCVRR